MLHKWVTEHKRSLKTAVMLSLRNNTSLQTKFLAFLTHFLFHAGSWAPHCVTKAAWSSPGTLVLWDLAILGQFSCSLLQQQGLVVTVAYCVSCMSNSVEYFLDSHIGFVVLSQQMWNVCPQYGLCWMVLKSFTGVFNSPPDLTPFTLD